MQKLLIVSILLLIMCTFNIMPVSSQYFLKGQQAVDHLIATGQAKYCDFSGMDLRDVLKQVMIKHGKKKKSFFSFFTQDQQIDISFSNLSSTNMSGIAIHDMIMINVDLSDANLSGSHVTGVNLKQSNFMNGNLEKINFSGVNLSYANFTSSKICKSSWNGVNVSHAYFKDADISESSWCGVNASYAHLSHANITSTRFSGVNLSHGYIKDVIGLKLSNFSGVCTDGIID